MAPTSRPIREGLILGLIAYLAVAVFYALFDLLAARGAFYTINVLGQVVFRGLRDPAVLQFPMALDLPAMALYNGVHLLLSLAIGVVVIKLALLPERRPDLARLAGIVIIAGFVATILAVGLLSTRIRPVLPWWSIVTANSVAVLLAGRYVLRRHPGIWRRLMPLGG